jgi:hypothetical protein
VKRRIEGLLRECELLSAEAARLNDEREFAAGNERNIVDITDLWREYLHMLISVKRDLIAKLRERQSQACDEAHANRPTRKSPCLGTETPPAE